MNEFVALILQPSLFWLQRTFDAPQGTDPVVVNMTSMGKGMVWINGENIGRYWISFKSALGQPSQSMQVPIHPQYSPTRLL